MCMSGGNTWSIQIHLFAGPAASDTPTFPANHHETLLSPTLDLSGDNNFIFSSPKDRRLVAEFPKVAESQDGWTIQVDNSTMNLGSPLASDTQGISGLQFILIAMIDTKVLKIAVDVGGASIILATEQFRHWWMSPRIVWFVALSDGETFRALSLVEQQAFRGPNYGHDPDQPY